MRGRGRGKKTLVLLVLLTAAGLAGYWYFEPQARPAWLSDRLPVAPGATVELYRWRSADGQWQLSDTPPPPGTPYEKVTYRHDANVLE